MSLVDDIAERQQRPRFGGWPRPSWTPATNREPDFAVFDAGDIDYLVREISPGGRAAIDTMLVDAHVSEVEADAIDAVGDDHGTASFYRDYARTVRAACRVAQARIDAAAPARLPGRLDAAAVRGRVDLVAYIERDVPLRKVGADRYVGLCPFHEDRSPSMSVWTDGRWKCFGCGAGGDVFAFVMRRRGCSFREAINIVAGGS